jgi:hypothetical protein
MNRHPRAPRRRFVLLAVACAALIGVVALTACGSSPSDEKAPAADQEQARKYAQCIRDNGVPDFPDPDPNGRFSAEHDQNDPELRAAQEKCRDLAPGGEHENFGDPAFVEQAREFAQCVRDNGVPDFPDPDADGRFRGVGHEQQDNPKFRAAQEKCRGKLPGGGEHR